MTARFDFAAPVPAVADLGRVHLVAVGGAGMSAVARLLLARGVPVSGCDAAASPTTESLQAAGALVHVGHDAAHVADADTVVVSSAVRPDNPEVAGARARGLPVLHRAQALAVLMAGRVGVAVAGANGKTTTTAMLATGLRHAGLDPSFAVGGELTGLGTNAVAGTGDAFVVEADESDGSFLVYRPHVAVVTNVQPDHLDFYGSYDGVVAAYAAFVRSIAPGGLLVACADDPGSAALAREAEGDGVRVVTYGQASGAGVRVGDTGSAGRSVTARLETAAGSWPLRAPLPGVHNLLNATAAFTAAVAGLHADPALVLDGLAAFTGTRRRFEVKGEAGGVTVVDDYAHNPGKVAALLTTAARLAAPGRLVVLFQPHLYSRTRDFAEAFGRALAAADVVLVMDVYAAREDPVPGVTGALVADQVPGRPAGAGAPRVVRFLPPGSDPAAALAALVRPGDLVLTVGAGDVTAVGPRLLRLLGGGADR